MRIFFLLICYLVLDSTPNYHVSPVGSPLETCINNVGLAAWLVHCSECLGITLGKALNKNSIRQNVGVFNPHLNYWEKLIY